jgi:hypothetical protein
MSAVWCRARAGQDGPAKEVLLCGMQVGLASGVPKYIYQDGHNVLNPDPRPKSKVW